VEFLGDRRAAEDGPAFENAHGKAGFREVTGAGEAVVPPPITTTSNRLGAA
jgi:hypothetical protein